MGHLRRKFCRFLFRSPILNTAGGIIPLSPFFATFTAVQPGVAPNLALVGGSELGSTVIMQNNTLWGVQTVLDNGQAALRWFQVDVDTNKVFQEGLIKSRESISSMARLLSIKAGTSL